MSWTWSVNHFKVSYSCRPLSLLFAPFYARSPWYAGKIIPYSMGEKRMREGNLSCIKYSVWVHLVNPICVHSDPWREWEREESDSEREREREVVKKQEHTKYLTAGECAFISLFTEPYASVDLHKKNTFWNWWHSKNLRRPLGRS